MATQAISVDTLPSYNPATGETLEQISKTRQEELPAIVSRARVAQEKWRETSIDQRRALLVQLKQTLLAARNDLAAIVVRESGKPHVEALFSDVFVSLDTAAYYEMNLAKLLRPERVTHHSSAAKLKSGKLYYEPLGVVGIVSSWNYPLAIPMGQIIAAIAVAK